MRQCLFAYTAPGADYPEYVSINREDDGRVTITVRGPKRPPFNPNEAEYEGQNKHPFEMSGHGAAMTLPDEEAKELVRALAADALAKSETPKAINYTLNGDANVCIGDTTMTYEQACKLGRYNPDFNPSVVVSYKNGASLAPRHGQSFEMQDGMSIYCMMTGNA